MLRYTIFLITFLVCNQSLLSGNGAITQSSSSNGFRWTSDDVIFHVHGPDSESVMGYRIGGLGDINGDGYDDVAISLNLPSSYGEYGMRIYFGNNPPDTLAYQFFGRGIANDPQMMDMNGDGILDMVVGAEGTASSGFRFGVFLFRGWGDSLASKPYDSLCPQLDNFGFGRQFQVALAESDAWPDLLVSQEDRPFPDSLVVYYFSGLFAIDTIPDWIFKINKSYYNLGPIGFVDFNGDGLKDIYVTLHERQDTLPRVLLFLGPSFADSPDFVIGAPVEGNVTSPRYFAQRVFALGDIDGNGFEDLAIDFAGDYYIYQCGPSADTICDQLLAGKHWYAAQAGDINGDGQPDVVTGDGSAFGSVSAFLGGIEWDVNVDATIDRFDLPALNLDEIGYRVASAGDFDGDGFDDVIFACKNFAPGPGDNPGDVFIVKGGPHIVTDVDSDSHCLVTSFALHPNYPNPFNPSTTISFDLPRRAHVTLSIVNILGQEVAKLVDQEMSAGSHSVEWDGRDASGEPAASGVYLYRLETEDGVLSRKMLLLK